MLIIKNKLLYLLIGHRSQIFAINNTYLIVSFEFIHPINNLYPIDIMIAPVKSPINPDNMKPPTTPINIISIGTGAPFPSKIGLIILSDVEANSK